VERKVLISSPYIERTQPNPEVVFAFFSKILLTVESPKIKEKRGRNCFYRARVSLRNSAEVIRGFLTRKGDRAVCEADESKLSCSKFDLHVLILTRRRRTKA
jgi:hypothetical protein